MQMHIIYLYMQMHIYIYTCSFFDSCTRQLPSHWFVWVTPLLFSKSTGPTDIPGAIRNDLFETLPVVLAICAPVNKIMLNPVRKKMPSRKNSLFQKWPFPPKWPFQLNTVFKKIRVSLKCDFQENTIFNKIRFPIK